MRRVFGIDVLLCDLRQFQLKSDRTLVPTADRGKVGRPWFF
jgi:hypothetical protein